MGGREEIYQDKVLKKNDGMNYQWVIMEGGNDICESESIEESVDSTVSSSSSSSAIMEDATSSSSSSPSPSSYGPLYELSELMAQLPIRRGLSKYYQGKSQSFASLASVKSLEDLAKGRRPYRRKMKSCGGGLDYHMYSPKATISKKNSRVSLLSSLGRRGTLLSSCRTSIAVQKNL